MWSNSSRCRIVSVYVMTMFMIIALDIVITLRFSINCSAVICSPTIIFTILREASSATYGPRVYFPSYKFPIYNTSFRFTLFAIFTFNLYHKNTKNIILSSLSDLTFVSDLEGIDNPFIALVASSQFVCVGAWDF